LKIFTLVHVLPIAFNCTCNCLSNFLFHVISLLPNSIISLKVQCHFHLDPWFFICSLGPLTIKLLICPLIWSISAFTITRFFFHFGSLFWISSIKLLIHPIKPPKKQIKSPNFNLFQLKPKLTDFPCNHVLNKIS